VAEFEGWGITWLNRFPRTVAEIRRIFRSDGNTKAQGQSEISSDGFKDYPGTIDDAFGIDCAHGQIVKNYGVQGSMVEPARRYSPAQVISVTGVTPEVQGRKVGRFTVIDGNRR
jgi:hypothetical protein